MGTEKCAEEVLGATEVNAFMSAQPMNLLRRLNDGQPVTTTISTTSATLSTPSYSIYRPIRRISYDLRGIITLPRKLCRDYNGRYRGLRGIVPAGYDRVNENTMWGSMESCTSFPRRGAPGMTRLLTGITIIPLSRSRCLRMLRHYFNKSRGVLLGTGGGS